MDGADAIRLLRTQPVLVLMSFDSLAWMASIAIATTARLDFNILSVNWSRVLLGGILAAAVHTVFARLMRLHQGRAPVASLEEMVWLAAATLATGTVLFVANFMATPTFLPRSVPLGALFSTLVIQAWGRASWRRWREFARVDTGGVREPVLILGAGDGGRQLIRSMQGEQSSGWRPVGLLDDNHHKRHLRIGGVPVLGRSTDIAAVAGATGVSTLVVAIPTASAQLMRQVSQAAADVGVAVKVLPSINELMHGRVGIADVRDIELTDLLGRRQIDTDLASIAGYLIGKRVLVTGAGGSIGSELCRQINKWDPAELIMLDRDESALHAVQLSIHGHGLLDSPDVVLADIRDAARMDEVFARTRPEVVFHAAALKHLPILEQYPAEAVKTNVWGTLNVLEAATAVDVERFVNISTDKAANPTSVLGYSKRIAEGLTAAVAGAADGTYLSVRFGNVLGSRGSVVTTFAAQITAGGPVTVTHPDVTRYFMTVEEAVQLVIQAAAIGRPAEALVLDMGTPVRIDDVARQLIELAGRTNIDVHYTGLRSGEKMHEELFGDGEPDHRPVHSLVSHVDVPLIDTTGARGFNPRDSRDAIMTALREACGAMSTSTASGRPVPRP